MELPSVVIRRHSGFERVYLLVVIPLGLFCLFFNPPFQGVPDELAHYHRALALAQGRVFSAAGAVAPKNYVQLFWELAERKEGVRKVVPWRVRRTLTTPPSEEQVSVPGLVGYASPLAFLPQATGLRIGLWLRAPPLVAFLLGRLLTFTAATALILAAIRRAPQGKIVFCIVGLLPVVIQQTASFSYDALHLGGVMLFTAHMLALALQPAALARRDKLGALVLSLGGALLKPGFVLLSLLGFLLPERQFASRRARTLFLAGLLAVPCAAWGLLMVVSDPVPGGGLLDPAAQARFVLANPFEFMAAVARAILQTSSYLVQSVVFRPGQNYGGIPMLFYVLAFAGVTALLRSQDEHVSFTRRQRAALLATAVLQSLFVFLLLYLVSTPPGAPRVVGVQGRYFVGLLPLFLLAAYKSGFDVRAEWIRRRPGAAVFVLAALLGGYAVFAVLQLFY